MFRVLVTYGVPLDNMISILHEQGYLIDWVDFIEQSIKEGWKFKSTLVKIEVSLIDTFGKDYSKEVINRIQQIMGA
jgi:hypothetical protein